MATLGLAVITKNEERVIQECLESVPIASKKIVVDSQSTDKTVEISKSCNAQVIVREWPGYGKQKRFAMEQIDCDWILLLDADEFLTQESIHELENLINQDDPTGTKGFDAYELPIYYLFLKRPIKYGKGPSYPIRLIKNGKGAYNDLEISESIEVPSNKIGRLKFGALHDTSPTLHHRLSKIQRDTDLELQYAKDLPVSFWELFVLPFKYFVSYTIKKSAWRDGIPGMILLTMFTFQIFLQYAKIYEYQKLNSLKKES